jgi:hypothetical protein
VSTLRIRGPRTPLGWLGVVALVVLVLGGGSLVAVAMTGDHPRLHAAGAYGASAARTIDDAWPLSSSYASQQTPWGSSNASSTSSTSPSSSTPPTSAGPGSAAPAKSTHNGSAGTAKSSTSQHVAGLTVAPPSVGGRPGPGNTGIPAGTNLTVVRGNQTYSKKGQVISGLDIHGIVTITGANITFKNSIVRGPDSSPSCLTTGVIKAQGTNTTVQDVEVSPTAATACMDGVWTASATLVRLNIHGTVDGVKADGNTRIQDSYIHDLRTFAHDPNQGGGATHNDAVQSFGAGSNIYLVHNYLNVSSHNNATYQLSQDRGIAARNIHIESNWLSGGGCTLNLSSSGGAAITAASGLYVVNNRFSQGTSGFDNCPILLSLNVALAVNSGNVWDGSGKPISAPQQHN